MEGAAAPEWAAALFSVGHQPAVELSEAQRQLFQSFQSNLVSLLSHELRTPLMAIQNALATIDEQGQPLGTMSIGEALETARRQSRRLEATLSTVLDLAAWEAGSLRMSFAEASLEDCLEASGLRRWVRHSAPAGGFILADANKLSRAFSRLADFVEVCAGSVDLVAGVAGILHGRRLEIEFSPQVQALSAVDWRTLWHEVQIAREAGKSLPLHVFSGVLQSERGFLSRTREGLGADLHLVAEVLRQHEASFEAEVSEESQNDYRLRLAVEFPAIVGRQRIARALQAAIWPPGSTTPQPLLIRLHLQDPGLPRSYPWNREQGPWIEIRDSRASDSRIASSGVAEVRCPENGYEPELLLSQLLQGRG